MLPAVSVLPAGASTRAVVLVLHGGREHGLKPPERVDIASLRMLPFARAVRSSETAVWRIRYRVRGWNDEQRSPVADARWALDEVRRRHGGVPVVLLGHSMGGRAAVHVLDDPSVVGMVALCPWLPSEPADTARDRHVVVAHAAGDLTTSPVESLDWATRAAALAASMSYITVLRSGHAMLRRLPVWQSLVVRSVGQVLAGSGEPGLQQSLL